MRFLWMFFKYLLRSAFSIIIFLLFIWWAKMNWNIWSYINFLDGTTWSVFHRSQPATRVDPFWPHEQFSGSISDVFSDPSGDSGTSWLDVYDPNFGSDLNSFSGEDTSGEDQSYWFTASGQASHTTDSSGGTSQSALLNLIKQHENTK